MLHKSNKIQQISFQVVTGRPDEMKTSLITNLWEIFKEDVASDIGETIVASYGNKETDVKAYTNCGLPKERIYIVNTYGELRNLGSGVVSSYEEQAAAIDSIFPKLELVRTQKLLKTPIPYLSRLLHNENSKTTLN